MCQAVCQAVREAVCVHLQVKYHVNINLTITIQLLLLWLSNHRLLLLGVAAGSPVHGANHK